MFILDYILWYNLNVNYLPFQNFQIFHSAFFFIAGTMLNRKDGVYSAIYLILFVKIPSCVKTQGPSHRDDATKPSCGCF